MTLESRIAQDLKEAMLAGEQQRVVTLRGIKSVLLYEKVAKKLPRDQELSDDEVVALLSKEAKKRQESADLYIKGGSQEKADAELAEKSLIENYLPEQLSEAEVAAAVDAAIAKTGASSQSQMGQVIGMVRQQLGAAADGSLIAKIAKERLS